jgi:hypothetical protein
MKKNTLLLLTFGTWLAVVVSGRSQSTFTKITTGPVVTDGGYSLGCAWGDYDGDGYLDLFIANGPDAGESNFLYHNNTNGTFTRITAGSIATDTGQWRGVCWADFDNDGNLDLAVARTDENAAQVVIYMNNGGGTFTRLPNQTVGGIVISGDGNSFGPEPADYDGDGFLDLFVARINGVDWLYHNDGKGGFTSITNNVLGAPTEDSFNATWADYNNDGKPDLFVTVYSDPPTNRLYQNLGDGSFKRITSGSVVTDSAHSVSSAWGDYDNDGNLDLFVANGALVGDENNFLYHNNGGGTFTRMTSDVVGSIASDAAGFGICAWGDYDNDGYLDLVVTTLGVGAAPGVNYLYHNNGDGSFTRILSGSPVEDVGVWVGCAWGDYDNDGFLDLFVTSGGVFSSQNNVLYHNNGNSNNWLKVKCVGTVSNRSAIGAKVRVKATIGGKTFWQLREINPQNALLAHFGLGNATSVDLVRIEWPSGAVQEFPNVAAKQFLTFVEPPRLQPLSRLTDGSFQLSLTGGLGLTYDVQRSTNLAQWAPWTTLTNTQRTMIITDTNAASLTQRFYRAISR